VVGQRRNAVRLRKLVNSLLDFSRIEAGRVQASDEPTDIATLTSEVASAFRSLVERAGPGADHWQSLAELRQLWRAFRADKDKRLRRDRI